MACLIESRVVRGPDWNWADQDGGDGHLGTVCEIIEVDKGTDGSSQVLSVKVTWDCGRKANYRTGYDNKYDLRLYSDSQTGIARSYTKCQVCDKNGMTAMRWKCSRCDNYIICETCYHGDKHDTQHAFLRLDGPHSKGVLVGERHRSEKTQAMGMFAGATVKRGPGWKYENQDGGKQNHGKVTALCGYDEHSSQTAVIVEWPNRERHKYRLGHEGAVKAKLPAPGGMFYKDHLPVLGEGQCWLKGARVMVATDENTLMRIHGETYSELVKKIGKICAIDGINTDGHVTVTYATGDTWSVKPFLLKEVICFNVGDEVRVNDNVAMVKLLQNRHGGWINSMKKAIGREGTVIHVDFPEIKVKFVDQKWCYHHGSLILLNEAEPNVHELLPQDKEVTDDDQVQQSVNQLLQGQKVMNDDNREPGNNLRRLVQAAQYGELDEVAHILLQHPDLVDKTYRNYNSLQIASHQGHIKIVKHLLKMKASTEIGDASGDTALHFAVIGGQPTAVDCLLQHNADVNASNNRKHTALLTAAAKGDVASAKHLLRHGADINRQERQGLTALHIALHQHEEEFALLLLNQTSIDLSLRCVKDITALHFAVAKKHPVVAEQIIRKDPSVIDLTMVHSVTPLYLAASMGRLDIAKVLLDQGNPDFSLRVGQSTTLHMVTWRGHTPCVELLLSKGANPNEQDKDGDNCLHLAVKRRYSDQKHVQDSDTLRKIQRESSTDSTSWAPADAFICLFIQADSDLKARDKRGKMPLDYLDDHNESNIKNALLKFAEKYHVKSTPKQPPIVEEQPGFDNPAQNSHHHSEFTIPRVKPEDVYLMEVLGQGGFGKVHKARWRGTEVAAKIVSMSGSQISVVEREISCHERALHPNIVRLMGIGYKVDEALIIMQYIDGKNLDYYIFTRRNADLSYADKLHVATDILSALTFLHATKILHLDIKPDNILLEHKSKKAYLCDLGLAHIKNRSTMTLSTSLHGGPRGTPHYVPPEMVEGENKPWAIAGNDIWSMACTFLEMFTGKRLWPPRTELIDIVRTFMIKGWVPPILRDTDPTIRRILEPCFKQDPRLRTPAKELLHAFEALRGQSMD